MKLKILNWSERTSMGTFIFNRCSEKTKIALQHFCKTINESDAEIFVVMAQKALCLYKLLLKHGLVERKEVVSSTSIDFNRNRVDWSNKKIVLIDDIIVSGSALAAATHRLKENLKVNIENLTIIALARDVDYQTMKFTCERTGKNLLHCGVDCNDTDCIEISYEISRLLSYYGIPYDTDYPSFIELTINKKLLKKLYTSPLWDTFNITNEDNKENHITNLTLFPTNLLKIKLWEILGINLDNLVHLKYRIYIEETHCTQITVVPKALLNEVDDIDLLDLFEYFKTNLFDNENIGSEWTTKTKFRFVQYFIAHKFIELLSDELLGNERFVVNKEWLKIQFGDMYSDIYNVITTSSKKENSCIVKKELKKINPNTFNFCCSKLNETYSQFEVNEFLMEPFKNHHFEMEIKTRESLKKMNTHFTKDFEIIEKYANRLRKGFSLNSLINIYSDELKFFDCEKIISLNLDRAIDLGIVVPITYHNHSNGYICRAYRHGEDLPFGEADKYRTVYFLKCLSEYFWLYNIKENPATITFEKMIVLFYQMGLNHGDIFNRFLGFENYPVLKERFCIHGAIATCFENEDYDKHVYTEMDMSVWVTKWLKKIGLIKDKGDSTNAHYKIDDNKVEKYLKDNECGNLSLSIKVIIESFANIIATWFSTYQDQKKKFKDDITALTSCYNNHTFASAILTEIHYFKRFWDNQAKEYFSNVYNQYINNEPLIYSTTEKALKSGRDKHKWFVEKRAATVIEDVRSCLLSSKNPYSSLWSECIHRENIPISNELEKKIQEALGYLYFYSACYEWLSKGYLFNRDTEKVFARDNENAKKYFLEFEKCSKKSSKLINLFSIFKEVEKVNDIDVRIRKFRACVSKILNYSEKLMQEIEDEISEKSEIYSIYYESCFVVDIKTRKDDLQDIIFLKLWDKLNEDINKTRLNLIHAGYVEGQYQRYLVFFKNHLGSSNISKSYLFKVYKELKTLLSRYAYSTRIIYIPNVPYNITMKHNTKKHIAQYVESFSDSFINYITPYFKNHLLHQMIFIDDYISDETKKAFLKIYINEENLGEMEIPDVPNTMYACRFEYKDSRCTMEHHDYSTIDILLEKNNSAEVVGTGFLFSHKEVFAVTCQHVANSATSNYIYFRFKGDSQIFKAKILNYRKNGRGINYPAEKEILLLRPEDKALIKINKEKLFSQIFCVEEKTAKKFQYKTFGYPRGHLLGLFIDGIVFNGKANNDFYSLTATKKKISKGFSGASLVTNTSDSLLLGMHYSHIGENLYVIPSCLILSEIEKRNK